jgi:glycerol-3-phosphate dehydrogenase subunit B
MTLARLFDTPGFRHAVAQAILPRLGSAKRVGFPAVLGIHNAPEVLNDLENQLGVPVFEIPGLTPSIPGIRLHNTLVKAIQGAGGQVYSGMQVLSSDIEHKQVLSVFSEAAARTKSHRAQNYILGSGGFLGGGFTAHESGHAQEIVFGLPIKPDISRKEWLHSEFVFSGGHPIFRGGIAVNQQFTPVDLNGKEILTNLTVVGGALGGFDPLRERSLEGVALTSGYWAAFGRGEVNHD